MALKKRHELFPTPNITFITIYNNVYSNFSFIFLENNTQHNEQNYTLELFRVFGTSSPRARKDYRCNNKRKRICTTYCSISHTTGSITFFIIYSLFIIYF